MKPNLPDMWKLTKTMEQILHENGIPFTIINSIDMKERICNLENVLPVQTK